MPVNTKTKIGKTASGRRISSCSKCYVRDVCIASARSTGIDPAGGHLICTNGFCGGRTQGSTNAGIYGGTLNKRNYSRESEKIMEQARCRGEYPRLLLHSCCAPCSSHCLELLREYFQVTVFYYNPNITEMREYEFRKAEELRLIREYNAQVERQTFDGMHSSPAAGKIEVLESPYDPGVFMEAVRGYEHCPEGGDRCGICFTLRLQETARRAAENHFDFFTTTLTISPLKDAERLNRIGEETAEEYGVAWLPSDFKKKDGYKRSIELSARFGLYRQNYCGCIYSRQKRTDSAKQ